MVIIRDGEVFTYEGVTDEYYLVNTPAEKMREGYPLSSILINKKVNKYDVYLTEEDKKIGEADDSGFIDFIEKVEIESIKRMDNWLISFLEKY